MSLNLLDENRVKDLVTIEDYQVITSVLLRHGENFLNVMLKYLSPNIRDGVIFELGGKAPQIMKDEFLCRNAKNFQSDHFCPNWMNVIQFIVDHTDDTNQLLRLVEEIITIHEFEERMKKKSIWSDYLFYHNRFLRSSRNMSEKVDKFLKCISTKLGESALQKLVRHNDGNGEVILRAHSAKQDDLVRVLLKYVKCADRDEIISRLNRGSSQ